MLVTIFALAAAFGAVIVEMDPFSAGSHAWSRFFHDALDDSTKCQGGILELFNTDASLLLVLARDAFQSHKCRQLLGHCKDPEVIRQNDVEGDRDLLGRVRASFFAKQRTRWRRHRHRSSFSVRDHQCEVLEQICCKRLLDKLILGLVAQNFH